MSKRLAPILERLARGETIENHKEGGNSMTPLIHNKEPFTLSPVDTSLLEVGDIVLAKVSGRFYTHKVTALKEDQVQIGNNKGNINGWTPRDKVFGIVSAVNGVARSSAAAKIKKADSKD